MYVPTDICALQCIYMYTHEACVYTEGRERERDRDGCLAGNVLALETELTRGLVGWLLQAPDAAGKHIR